jgi:hypothetical protein
MPKRTALLLLALLLIASPLQAAPNPPPPQVWSHHKMLGVEAGVCAKTARQAVMDLGFAEVSTREDYTYAHRGSNRAAIKCVSLDRGTFMYLAVAGPDWKAVKKLRNEIAAKF